MTKCILKPTKWIFQSQKVHHNANQAVYDSSTATLQQILHYVSNHLLDPVNIQNLFQTSIYGPAISIILCVFFSWLTGYNSLITNSDASRHMSGSELIKSLRFVSKDIKIITTNGEKLSVNL